MILARSLRLAIILPLLLGARDARAAAGCTLVSAGPMTFTGYTPFGGAGAATASVTVACGNNPDPLISVAATPRTLTAAGQPGLPFELYTDAAHTAPWQANQKVAFNAAANTQTTVTLVFGGIAAGQDAAAATYTASVTVSLFEGNKPGAVGTAQLTVQLTVPPTCVVGAGTLAFGNYYPTGAHQAAPLDAQGTIGVSCTTGTFYRLGLGYGANPAGTTRQMANGSARVAYEIYTDPARATVWTPTVTVNGTTASTAAIQLPVYGRIPPGQTVTAAGAFQDTVLATVTF